MKVKETEKLAEKKGDQHVIENKKKQNQFASIFYMQNVTTEEDVIGSIFINIFWQIIRIRYCACLTMFQFILFLCLVFVLVVTSIMFLSQSLLVGYSLSHKLKFSSMFSVCSPLYQDHYNSVPLELTLLQIWQIL